MYCVFCQKITIIISAEWIRAVWWMLRSKSRITTNQPQTWDATAKKKQDGQRMERKIKHDLRTVIFSESN